jgi:hypothetical protein
MWGATPCIKISTGLRLGWQMYHRQVLSGVARLAADWLAKVGQGTRAIHRGFGHRSITSTAVYTALGSRTFGDRRRTRTR